MGMELRLLDQIKLVNHLTRNFACDYSEDDRFFIITETGIYILSLKCNLSYVFPSFQCSKKFFQVSNFTPCANVDLDINTFHKDLDRKTLYETVMASEYSANLKHAKSLDPQPLSAQWSPAGIVNKSDCLLGVLTNMHSLEIYFKYIDENELINYQILTNITEEIIAIQKDKWRDPTRFSISLKFEEFKNRVNDVSVTAFTWTHKFQINGKNNCVLIAGLLNGDLTVWRFEEINTISKEIDIPQFLGRYSTQLQRITSLHWHLTSEFGGGLSFGDVQGRINILSITELNTGSAVINKEFGLWTQEDKIVVDKLTVLTHEKHTYILAAKQNVLLIFGINEEGVIFDQKVESVEEYYITGIYHHKNVIIVLSLTGSMTQFTLSGKRSEIVITRKKIPVKADIQDYRTHGFFFSNNMVFCGILLFPKTLQQLSTIRVNITLYIFYNCYLNPTEILWQNPSGKLKGYWDCFETLRLICLKEKRFPWVDLPSDLNLDKLTLLQLKTLRHIAKLSENVFNVVPRIQHYNIKPFIVLHYLLEIKLIVARMKRLFSLKASGKELTQFQLRSLDIQNFFLKEMVVRDILPKASVGKNFVNEITEVIEIANELEYPDMMQCVWCGEKLIGSSCLPPHADSRCCFTMMPIFFIPSYKCSLCHSVAHWAIKEEMSIIICPYCDQPMDKVPYDTKQLEETAKKIDIDCNGEVKSICFEDCVEKDFQINFDDIEDKETDFVFISDCEEEDDESREKLKALYLGMSQCSLEELMAWDIDQNEVGAAEGEPSTKNMKLQETDGAMVDRLSLKVRTNIF